MPTGLQQDIYNAYMAAVNRYKSQGDMVLAAKYLRCALAVKV